MQKRSLSSQMIPNAIDGNLEASDEKGNHSCELENYMEHSSSNLLLTFIVSDISSDPKNI